MPVTASAAHLLGLGPSAIIVTRGRGGATWIADGSCRCTGRASSRRRHDRRGRYVQRGHDRRVVGPQCARRAAPRPGRHSDHLRLAARCPGRSRHRLPPGRRSSVQEGAAVTGARAPARAHESAAASLDRARLSPDRRDSFHLRLDRYWSDLSDAIGAVYADLQIAGQLTESLIVLAASAYADRADDLHRLDQGAPAARLAPAAPDVRLCLLHRPVRRITARRRGPP